MQWEVVWRACLTQRLGNEGEVPSVGSWVGMEPEEYIRAATEGQVWPILGQPVLWWEMEEEGYLGG